MSVYTEYTPPSTGVFLKIEPNTTVKLQLASDPYIFNNEYQGNISQRYAWVVWNLDEEEAQILQLSVTTFRQLKALAEDEDYGDPTEYPIKITRSGSGTETKYQITPSPKKSDLSEDAKAKCAEIVLTDKIKGAISLDDLLKGKEVPAPEVQEEDETPPPVEPDGDINLDDIPF
jgi:hypothetical protein